MTIPPITSIPDKRSAGFTFVEVLVVLLILSVGIGLIAINSGSTTSTASLSGFVNTLVGDIKSQQVKSMVGNTGSDGVAEPFGVYLQAGQYTLFKDTAYNAASADNFAITNPGGITIATTFPSAQLIFTQASGDVTGFVNGSNTITITNTNLNNSVSLTVNRYGAITIN